MTKVVVFTIVNDFYSVFGKVANGLLIVFDILIAVGSPILISS